jgi:hypothetical protein
VLSLQRSAGFEAVAAANKAANMATRLERLLIVSLPVVLVAGICAWLLVPTLAETEFTPSIDTAVLEPAPEMDDRPVTPNVPHTIIPQDAANIGRVRLTRQSFSRGGLGSKALMTFTVRNANAYAVKDLKIACAFRSRDGSYATERRRLIAETVGMKSRKAFPPTLIGFVNIKAETAKCALVTASRA